MRLFLFIVNFMIALFAIALIVIAGIAIDTLKEHETIFENNAGYLAFSVLAVGMLLLILGITGIFGACVQGTRTCLFMHLVMLTILVMVEIVAVVLLLYYSADDKFEKKIDEVVLETFSKYGGEGADGKTFTDSIDMFQETLECCGKTSWEDWSKETIAIVWAGSLNKGIYLPDSCCKVAEKGCGTKIDLTDKVAVDIFFYTQGCESKIQQYLDKWSGVVIALLVAICFLQILCLIFTITLVKKNK